MTKIDYDLLVDNPSTLNTLKQRNLVLRNLRIQAIENMILTKNQNDSLDLTNNDIKKLENFPLLPRLSTLLISNNRICRIDPEITTKLVNLTTLILTNNQLAELGDLEPLFGFKKLKYLSLLENPVTFKPHYREFVIAKLPSVKYLDYKKVTDKETQAAVKLFTSSQGAKVVVKTSTFEPGEAKKGPSPAEKEKIKEALSKAKTLDEITMLERKLLAGQSSVHR